MRIRTAAAIAFVVCTLYGIGALVLMRNPSTEVEKSCINKTAVEFINCINEGWDRIRRDRGGNG